MSGTDRWWLRVRFSGGRWELVDQTDDPETMARWDDEIDAAELETGRDREWILEAPYGERPADFEWLESQMGLGGK